MNKNLTFFDIEIANTKNSSICQIGIVNIDGLNINKMNVMVNPNDDFDQRCISIHHITKEDVANEKKFNEVWSSISKYFTNSIVIAHNALGADLSYLIKNLVRYKLDVPIFYYICTKDLAKKYIPAFVVDNKYGLSDLCKFYNIAMGNHHNALDDAFSCYQIFQEIRNQYDFKITNEINKREANEHDYEYKIRMTEPLLRKSINTLYGLIRGIVANKKVVGLEIKKLKEWVIENDKYKDSDPFNEIISTLDDVLSDNFITLDEQNILLELMDAFSSSSLYSESTLGAQVLLGFMQGIIIDNNVDKDEIESLQKWLYENDHLKGFYPFNEIFPMVNKVLEDGILTQDEKTEIFNLFDNIINPIKETKENLVRFENTIFCLSGEFKFGSKNEVSKYIECKNGICAPNVTKKTDFLIVGGEGSKDWAYGNYGEKVKKANDMIKKGYHILILREKDLFSN